MSWLRRLYGTLRKEKLSDELDEELRAHLAMRAADNLSSGMSPEEARHDAQRRFGNSTLAKEGAREADTLPWLDTLAGDLRYAFRMLRKNPGYTVIAVLTMALGIGCTTAFFSVVNSVLLQPLPFPHPDELVTLGESKPNFANGSISYPNFLDWEKDNRAFTAMAIARGYGFSLTGLGEAEQVSARLISSQYFSILGARPLLGRDFAPGEDHLGAAPLALISDSFWKRKFSASTDVMGKTLTLDGKSYRIVGVIPNGFDLYRNTTPTDVYVPIGQWNNPLLPKRGAGLGIHGIARLKPGLGIQQARADMQRVTANLAATYPDEDQGIGATITALRRALFGEVQPMLLVLCGAVGFVLLIATFNVASLTLARSTSRVREFAVRAALGAGRGRLLCQLLTESTSLALIGGLLGWFAAHWTVDAALALLPAAVPRSADAGLNSHVLLFALAVSVCTGIFVGVFPALKSSGLFLAGALKESGRGQSGVRHRAQNLFVVLEMAMALMLLVGAGLTARTLAHLWQSDPGFDPHGVMTFTVAMPPSMSDASPAAIRAAFRDTLQKLSTTPGVQSLAASWGALPLSGDDEQLFWLDDQPKPANENEMNWTISYVVDPAYREVMRLPLVRGRFFTAADNENSRGVAVVDEVFAKKFFGGQDPLGHYLHLQRSEHPAEIIGVVGHVKQWGLDSDDSQQLRAQAYFPFQQLPDDAIKLAPSGTNFVVRHDGSNPSLFSALRAANQQISAEQVLFGAQTMEEIISSSLSARRFAMILFGIFASLALVLAAVGIYGVISYLVGQRTHEIGVRIALGARRGDVLQLVLLQGARLAMLGIAIGLLASLALTRLMARLVYGITATDPLTFITVALLLGLVAMAACYVPTRRAMAVDPVLALRCE